MSAGGIGLMAAAMLPGRLPPLHAPLELEFSLPDVASRLNAGGVVMWIDPVTEQRGSDGRVGIGVRFLEMPAPHRAALARYVANYRPHVAVAFASQREAELCRNALEEGFYLHPAQSGAELQELLSRGDISVVTAFGDYQVAGPALASTIRRPVSDPEMSFWLDPLALPAPRVVYCSRAAAEDLVSLHRQGVLYQSLPPSPTPASLRLAVLRATEDYAIRIELRRVSRELERAQRQNRAHTRSLSSAGRSLFQGMVAVSPAMRTVLDLVRIVSPHNLQVLIQGETGSGKELVARVIHELSARAGGPFVVVDCGALTDTLLEDELFGHIRGAFTGAVSDHTGLFELANDGTIFLDEVENTTPSFQAKLLRVLETNEVRPVGGTRTRQVDVRLIAASNRDLRGEVEAGRFRADLFYRVYVFPIEVPPLRSRIEDIVPLARQFVEQLSASLGRPVPKLAQDAARALLGYAWPGNVRELKNVLGRAALLTPPGRPIEQKALPPWLFDAAADTVPDRPVSEEGASLRQRVRRVEREIIREALQHHGGVLRRAARALRTNPVTLARRARQHGLWPVRHRSGARND